MSTETIDFDTMRAYCIQIHQEVFELFKVLDHIGENIIIPVKNFDNTISLLEDADELKTHPSTRTWEGMGRFAKELHDNEELWKDLPTVLKITLREDTKKLWYKEAARKELLNCHQQLGGKHLYK